MTKPPLYSRSGLSSPSDALGPAAALRRRAGDEDGARCLLEQAQQFSAVAVRHVEEVRRTLVRAVDTQAWLDAGSDNAFGGSHGTELAAAFEELTAAYGRLSSLKWDAARVEFEEGQRALAGCAAHSPAMPLGVENAEAERRAPRTPASGAGARAPESPGIKDHPWQEHGVHEWIADAFLNGVTSGDDDDAGDAYPEDDPLAALNAKAEPFPIASPPGFKAEGANQAEELPGEGSARTKPTLQYFTSISEISSHVNTDDDDSHNDEDSESEWLSDTSSSSEEPPSMENYDYLYKGGYAMQVSGGKETKGVVPKSVRRVLVDASVRVIEEGAFQGCHVLDAVTVPATVEAVGDHAFRKCSKLKHVQFLTRAPRARRRKAPGRGRDEKKEEQPRLRAGNSPPAAGPRASRLRSIGEWAFFNCSSLATVELPHGLESVGTRAFQRCSSLSLAEGQLPRTLTSVGENAFHGCPPQTKAAVEGWERARRSS